MAVGNTVTIVGNLTRDPEMRSTQSGKTITTFGVAWNKPSRNPSQNQEGQVCYFDVVCWDTLAQNVNDSLHKGARVTVTGRLEQRSWERQDGGRQSKVEIIADEVAPSLRWATATVQRTPRDDSYGGSPDFGSAPYQAPAAPYGQGDPYQAQPAPHNPMPSGGDTAEIDPDGEPF